jgi:hypothetical protein
MGVCHQRDIAIPSPTIYHLKNMQAESWNPFIPGAKNGGIPYIQECD